MDLSTFRAPDRIVFGAGSLATIAEEAEALGSSALLVTGRRAMAEAGITPNLVRLAHQAGLPIEVFEEVEPEPSVETVDRCRAAIRAAGGDVVIGLGGGSALDAAKVAAGLAGEDAPTAEFLHGRDVERPGLPFIAVPTTSGTGSEMTDNGVVSDASTATKASIRDPSFIPRLALLDPELTAPCPPDVTAVCGIDALVQAIESYLSRNATPLTESVSLRALDELAAALPQVLERGDDLELRTRAAWGSAMAGLALSNARLGVIHGMAHPLGIRYRIPHGLVCGVLLPPALEYNREAAGRKYDVLQARLGDDPAAYARRLLEACGLPESLAEYEPDPEEYDAIAEETLTSGSTRANPRQVAAEHVHALLGAVT